MSNPYELPRPCNHPTGPPRADVCAVCRHWRDEPEFRAVVARMNYLAAASGSAPRPADVPAVTPAHPLPAFDAEWSKYGPALWSCLHRNALGMDPGEFPLWVRTAFTAAIGCGECAAHWVQGPLTSLPEKFSSAAKAFEWSVRAHDEVNRRLGKPAFGLQRALDRHANRRGGGARRRRWWGVE